MQAAWFSGFSFCLALFARIANMCLGCFRHLFFGKNIFSMGALIPAVPEMLLPLTGWGRIDFNDILGDKSLKEDLSTPVSMGGHR
jgi:hypothetical protein